MTATTSATTVPIPLDEVMAIVERFEQDGRTEEAARLVRHVLAVVPDHADASFHAGIIAYRQGRLLDALGLMQTALAHGPHTAVYLRNLCEILRILGRLDEAVQAGQRAVALAPTDLLALHNLSIVHYHRCELDQAIAVADRALAIRPQMPGAHFARAEALLLKGEWQQGWDDYEYRFRIAGVAPLIPPEFVRPDVPHWDGRPMTGPLLIVADQGFGDVIQFCRYIPWAQLACPDIVIACSGEVVPMLRQAAPGARLSLRWAETPRYEAYVALSSLPRLHGTRPGTVPFSAPYLRAEPAKARHWAGRLAALAPPGLKRIGLVWAGRPTHNNDRNRSAGLDDFAPIASLPGIALIPLQKGPRIDQAGRYFGRAPLVNIGAEIVDYEDTMAILDSIDLLITVDTSVAHVAGAMGRPVWIMLAHAPDWRWLLGRDDTPWYPSARLFRQSAARAWREVTQAMAAALG